MSNQRNIVSFEEARRSAAERARAKSEHSAASRLGGVDAAGVARSSASLSNDPDEVSAAVFTGGKESFIDKHRRSKERRKKEKAEKAFAKAYGDGSGSSGGDGGPRAAVYKGEMGAKHRRANRIQEKLSGNPLSGISFKRFSFDLGKLPQKYSKLIGVVACMVLAVVLLYTPAQQYYQQMRERDRLAAEYEAIQERNDALQGAVEALQSEAGIEDRAHSEFGYVKEGEQAVAVTGVDLDNTSSFTANVVPGTVPAPDTWYSPVLDILFGYSG